MIITKIKLQPRCISKARKKWKKKKSLKGWCEFTIRNTITRWWKAKKNDDEIEKNDEKNEMIYRGKP